MSFFRSKAALSPVDNNSVPDHEALRLELEKLSSKELSVKLTDQKEGPELVDKVLANEKLLFLVLNKSAGTKDKRESIISMQENYGRFHSSTAFNQETINELNGIYLLNICKESAKFEEHLIKNAQALKAKGAIDDRVINDIDKAAAFRKVQFVSPLGSYD